MRCKSMLSLLFVFVLVSLAIAKDDNPAYTSADDAGKDFAIQGEYEGNLGQDGERWGAQVIALGDGKFRSVGTRGGLPGDGVTRETERHELEGKFDGDTVVFPADGFTLKIKDRAMSVESNEGEVYGELTKVRRKSPTLGAKPPAGATVLFDGTSTDHWNNGKIVEGKFLGATNTDTKTKLGDHKLHIEFRTPFMPFSGGQQRGNSGVYVQGRYEVQVLDSFGLEGKDNECGGIYSINQPIVNMCFPPLSWQTYDIDFTAAQYDGDKKVKNGRVTVRHNGVLIHDDLELTNGTPGRNPEGPADEALFLQDHSNPVVFRNVWIVEK